MYIVHNHAQKLGYLPYTTGVLLQPTASHTVWEQLATPSIIYHLFSLVIYANHICTWKVASKHKRNCGKICSIISNNNTQKAAIATLPLTTHPKWAEPHTFTSLEQIHAPITSLEWLNLPLLPFLPFHNLPS